jgi:DNA-binding PadR family transcriptional regulator
LSLQGALAALLLREAAHGYHLQSTLEAELGPLWVTKPGQVYLTLGRMVRDGLLKSRRIRQEAYPDRQLLALTNRGETAANRWLFQRGPSEEIVVRLAVARLVVPDRFEEVAESIAADQTAALRELRTLRREEERDQGFQPEALDAEILRIRAQLRWVSDVRERQTEIVRRPPARRLLPVARRYA